jgi:hypothetical protein
LIFALEIIIKVITHTIASVLGLKFKHINKKIAICKPKWSHLSMKSKQIRVTPEKFIERQILAFLNAQPNCMAWKNGHNGRALNNDSWIRTRGTLNGVADITAVYRRKSDGANVVIFFEVKTDKGRQSEHQKQFELNIKKLNGFYFIVRSITDASVALAQLEV